MNRPLRSVARLVLLSLPLLLLIPACGDDDPTGLGDDGSGPGPGETVAYTIPPFDVVRHGESMFGLWTDGTTTITVGERSLVLIEMEAGRFVLPVGSGAPVPLYGVVSTGQGKTYVTGNYVEAFDQASPPIFRFENGLRTRETIEAQESAVAVDAVTNQTTYLVAGKTLWQGIDGSWSPFAEFDAACTDIYAAGSGILFVSTRSGLQRYSESTWENVYPVVDALSNVAGIDEDQVMATAGSDVIACDGSPDFEVVYNADEHLNDVVWVDDTLAVAVGSHGRVIQYDGTGWSRVQLGFDGEFNAVGAWREGGERRVVIVGTQGAEYRYAAGDWTGSYLPPGSWSDVVGDGSGGVIALYRADGSVAEWSVYTYDGTTWESMPAPGDMRLYALFSRGDGEAWALGQQDIDSYVVHWDGTTWSSQWVASLESPSALWVDGNDVTYVACDFGTVYVNGAPETVVQPLQDLHGIWRDDEGGGVFVVGDAGTIARRTGISTWSTMDAGTDVDLLAVCGSTSSHVVAVGAAGTIRRFDGAVWTPMDAGLDADLDEVWTNGRQNIWVASSTGNLLAHFDGTQWRLIDVEPLGTQPKAVWTDGTDVWVTVGSILARYAEPPALESVVGAR